jgi:hypothetical protein
VGQVLNAVLVGVTLAQSWDSVHTVYIAQSAGTEGVEIDPSTMYPGIQSSADGACPLLEASFGAFPTRHFSPFGLGSLRHSFNAFENHRKGVFFFLRVLGRKSIKIDVPNFSLEKRREFHRKGVCR